MVENDRMGPRLSVIRQRSQSALTDLIFIQDHLVFLSLTFDNDRVGLRLLLLRQSSQNALTDLIFIQDHLVFLSLKVDNDRTEPRLFMPRQRRQIALTYFILFPFGFHQVSPSVPNYSQRLIILLI